MNKIELLKKLLPGFLPLIVFIVADSFLGTEMGIYFALAFGFISLIVIYLKERRFDKFVVADTILLVAMGGISLLLENDIFFKLKPAIIETIFCILIGFSAFSGSNLLLNMSRRYMHGIRVNEQAISQFNYSLKVLFWMLVLHSATIFYAAFYLSTEIWAFISGGLFYILFGAFLGYEFFRNRLNKKNMIKEEWFPLVDEKGNVTGKAPRSLCHSGSMLLHPVVHVHVLNHQGNFFLQKRSLTKDIQPGKWDTAVGGHIAFGENIETAMKREMQEEIGLQHATCHFVTSYVNQTDVEKELVYLFYTLDHQGIILNPEEIDEGKFWTWEEIKKATGKGILTPNLEFELNSFGKQLLSNVKNM
jgi:isopentenyldiphosphate isomerase/intracellular septation protein A